MASQDLLSKKEDNKLPLVRLRMERAMGCVVNEDCDFVFTGPDGVQQNVSKQDSSEFKKAVLMKCECQNGQNEICGIKCETLIARFDAHQLKMKNLMFTAKYPCSSCSDKILHFHISHAGRKVSLRRLKPFEKAKEMPKLRLKSISLDPAKVPLDTDMILIGSFNLTRFMCKTDSYEFRQQIKFACPCQGGAKKKCPAICNQKLTNWFDLHVTKLPNWPYDVKYFCTQCHPDRLPHFHKTYNSRTSSIHVYKERNRKERNRKEKTQLESNEHQNEIVQVKQNRQQIPPVQPIWSNFVQKIFSFPLLTKFW